MTSVLKFCRRWIPLLMLAAQFSAAAASSSGKIEYNRDVRPILYENCFACHGADSASRKASLRLDHLDDAIAPRKDSLPAIVPGKPDGSELIHRINNSNPDDIMPPTKTGKTLTPQQKETLRQWIASGAEYQPQWSFIAPKQPAIPEVHNHRWARNPIDNFILARLESEGLKPAPEADARTLIRRLSLDLTGLPPAPEDVEDFVKDHSSKAYEKLVDKFLASPRYGEHRGRYWLDEARYADTHGIHIDNYVELWNYRDWVIQAFNRNEPFDKFTVEQLAGDLLPHPTMDQRIATGFNRCNITTSEGGAIDEEYLVFYARDRTETMSQVWLGLTAGCAVCHDHKFDPLLQKEFYSMSAFFNNTTQAAMDGNIQDTPPNIIVPRPEDRARWKALPKEKKAAREKVDDRRKAADADYKKWLASVTPETFTGHLPTDEPQFHALLADNPKHSLEFSLYGENHELPLATNTLWIDGVLADKAFTTGAGTTPQFTNAADFDKNQPFSYSTWVYLDKSRSGAVFARMDDPAKGYTGWDFLMEDGKPATHFISKWPENALKVSCNKAIESKRWTHVCLTYDGTAKAAGMKIYIDGEPQEITVVADKLMGSTRTTVPFKIGQRNAEQALAGTGVQDIRLYTRALNPDEVKALAFDTVMAHMLSKPAEKRTDQEKTRLFEHWLTTVDSDYKERAAALSALEKEEMDIKARGNKALVMEERTNTPTAYVLSRGEYDKRRDKVESGTPHFLPPMASDLPRNRLGLARWLVSPENPLTARVTVNRFWQEIFGTGIVRTSGDFGVTGELPSNQELLDWMAVDFREHGWDVKRFFKQVVMSAAYRQSAIITPDKLAKDPDNRLLSRGPRFRMDAEMVRDYALAASGLLAAKIGGPSVRPYQPDGVWEAVAMIGSNTRDYKRDSGESLYRRSMYTFWKRAAPPASMEIFNAPSRETCTVRRERSDTPLQALVTLDDPQFMEAARNLAQLALEKGGAREKDRLDFMAERLMARPLQSKERSITDSVLKDLLTHYKSDPKDAAALISVGESKPDPKLDKPTLAAYAMVANELMNLDEVLNK